VEFAVQGSFIETRGNQRKRGQQGGSCVVIFLRGMPLIYSLSEFQKNMTSFRVDGIYKTLTNLKKIARYNLIHTHENVTAILELMAYLRRQRLCHDNAPNLSTQKDHTNCFSDIG